MKLTYELHILVGTISRRTASYAFSDESSGELTFLASRENRKRFCRAKNIARKQRIIKHSSHRSRSSLNAFTSKRSSLSSRDRGISLIASYRTSLLIGAITISKTDFTPNILFLTYDELSYFFLSTTINILNLNHYLTYVMASLKHVPKGMLHARGDDRMKSQKQIKMGLSFCIELFPSLFLNLKNRR